MALKFEFARVMAKLSIAYDKPMDEARIEIYWDIFKLHDLARLETAVDYCIEHYPHFPKPAEIKAALRATEPPPPQKPFKGLEPPYAGSEDDIKYSKIRKEYVRVVMEGFRKGGRLCYDGDLIEEAARAAGVSEKYFAERKAWSEDE